MALNTLNTDTSLTPPPDEIEKEYEPLGDAATDQQTSTQVVTIRKNSKTSSRDFSKSSNRDLSRTDTQLSRSSVNSVARIRGFVFIFLFVNFAIDFVICISIFQVIHTSFINN